jgi:glycosyltransferase involved in cell wall biosynthesis
VRIVLISRRFPPLVGGAEKVLSYLAPAIAAVGGGREVVVLTSRLDVESLPTVEEITTGRGGCRVERLATSRARFLGTALYMRNLGRRIASLKPDLCYVSMLKHDAFVAVGMGRRLGVPVVLRPEGAGATGDIAWQARGRFGRAIGRRCHDADAVVAISKAVRGELLADDYDDSRIVEIGNGVPVPAMPWDRRDDWQASPRAVFLGRLAGEKGLDVLIDAWPRVREWYPSATLSLVGEGPMREALASRRDALGLRDAIAMPGATDDTDAALRGADLFVLPSREEGMSIALLEAMALGVPLVASAIPGNRRLVSDFKTGRLAPVDDPEGLARAIIDQWEHLDRAIHMGRAARSLVQRHHSVDAVARSHLELFERLVAAKRSRSSS